MDYTGDFIVMFNLHIYLNLKKEKKLALQILMISFFSVRIPTNKLKIR